MGRLLQGLGEIEGTPGRFRPVTLNMAGLVLEREAGRLTDAPEQLIHRFVANAVKQPEIAEVAPIILERMITDGGTKRPLRLTAIASETGLGTSTVRGCLRRLARQSLVRPLDEAQETWEISHDFLAQIIGQHLGRMRLPPWRGWVRWVAPAALSVWLCTLIGAIWYWQTITIDRSVEALSLLGISVTDDSQAIIMQSGFSGAGLAAAAPYLDLLTRAGVVRQFHVDLSYIEDVSPLASLPKLESLSLSSALSAWERRRQVLDLSPLADLVALRRLSLLHLSVSDLSPLSDLTALRTLHLFETTVTDLSSLADLTALESLSLFVSNITDLSPLANLTALEVLNLGGTEVRDLSPLANLTALEVLNLGGTEVTDLSPLANLTALKELYLNGSEVRDLSPLASLSALQILHLTSTRVTDLSPLASLSALRSLDLQETSVSDLAPVEHVDEVRK